MRWLLAALAALVAATVAAYALSARGRRDGTDEQRAFVDVERPRATKLAAEFAHTCRPPCSVADVEPIAPGVWRVHLNFETGYCVLLYLEQFRRTGAGRHEGWHSTDCVGPPRLRG